MLAVAGCSNNVSVSENIESQTTSAVETEAAPAEGAAADNSDDQFVSAYPAFAVKHIPSLTMPAQDHNPRWSWDNRVVGNDGVEKRDHSDIYLLCAL